MNTRKRLIYFTFIIAMLAFLIWWFIPSKRIFKQVSFSQLPAWDSANLVQSLKTFQVSCRVFIKQDPKRSVGSKVIDLRIKDWQPACYDALNINPVTQEAAKSFFQRWFVPIEFYDHQAVTGLFTGYYMPTIKGSRTETADYNVPIYQMPKNVVTANLENFLAKLKNVQLVGRVENSKFVPYHSREQINKGAIKSVAPVLVWIQSPIDRVFLEIQGSGLIEFKDGTNMYIGYDGENGLPYTSIAAVLIKKGVLTKDNASMQGIKKYLEAHPEEMDEVLNQNKSFVFFKKMSLNAAYGSQGVPLTPGYSLAVDRKWVPMGMPIWLSTSSPDDQNPDQSKPFQRLMIAQDTGGAIRGKVRGDVYWGGGAKATMIAGHMKNKGQYWLLIPYQALPRLEKYIQH